MVNDNQILGAVFRTYDSLKAEAQNKAYEINAKLERDEKWVNNRYAIKDLSLQIARAKFEENTSVLKSLEDRREALKKEREEILKAHEISEEDLKPQYACKNCQDSGYDKDGNVCACFYKNLAKACEKILGIATPVLPTFNGYKSADLEEEKRKNLFVDYTNKFPPEVIKNLIFTGNPGSGKTFTAGCIASALIAKNYNVVYLTAVKLADIFLRYHTAGISDKQAIFSLLTSCDLLVIDDLGTEPILKNVTVEYLTAVISERLSENLPFIITTNLDINELKNRYTERFSSRISGSETARFSFSGKDKRLKK